jgi:hypothetical protein
MASAEALIALSIRLRKLSYQQTRRGQRAAAADVRLASLYIRAHAALIVADEAKMERDPQRKRALEQESAELWCRHD